MLVRESLYNFKKEIDPIKGSNIGLKSLIEKWLEKYNIKKYEINDDFTIDVNQVDLNGKDLTNFPDYIQFKRCFGFFDISNNDFTSFKGCPEYISGDFYCGNNEFENLEYFPTEIGNDLFIDKNKVIFTYDEIKSVCKVKGLIWGAKNFKI